MVSEEISRFIYGSVIFFLAGIVVAFSGEYLFRSLPIDFLVFGLFVALSTLAIILAAIIFYIFFSKKEERG